ncbi:MAG: 3-deoxy-manno-octulosonate cytidylyltransferase [Dissulfurimicrobium sp.]|uniref:3-deoxy-manno-octulosonate cytidylyltransferase n=1 Tax=Dissulfurimicrobium TaxID=1769732 RepID=UPI001ED9EFB3|nr:3-deoxy-manno-octulosonate cytidylyltransferase [Dissulfurimicrobium hydrothermale]UKL13697.1 3-deoxy-manno-octulosonate cytidylyltransferase [Dissulfurimicrobium hydrothermale]
MKIVAIIPARFKSTRLPGKPLADIGGRPMILHVYTRAVCIPDMDQVVVATDDRRISECIKEAGGNAVLTDPTLLSGTDRITEAARALGLSDEDIVVNIQGDQPLIEEEPVRMIIERLVRETELAITTPACPMDMEEAINPNRVKVVVDARWHAIYFSRALIPFDRDGVLKGIRGAFLRHVGLYAYRFGFLKTFAGLKPGALERIEQLEQLRAIENGFRIGVVKIEKAPLDVDTAEDLEVIRRLFKEPMSPL